MADLTFMRQAPLDHLALPAQAREALGAAGLGLGEIRFAGVVNLRARRDDLAARQALEGALGAALPGVGKTAAAGAATLIGIGPDEWLAAGGEGPALAERLAAACQGHFAGITDVSENYCTLVVSGPQSRTVLAKGCPLDLHPAVFQPGDAAGTLVAKATVVLRLLADGTTFHLLVRRSFADYLYRWLEDAGREFGVAVVKG